MKSHITLPKSTLNRFSRNGSLTYYDLNNKKIGKCSVRNFCVQENYFSKETEDYLSRELERKLGLLNKRLEKFNNRSEPFLVTEQDQKLIIDAVVFQTFRNPKTAEILKNNCISDLLFNSPNNFYNEWLLIENNFLRYKKFLSNILNEFRLNILEIRCNGYFFLPTFHYTEFQNQILFIMSPKMAFILMPPHKINQYIDELGPLYALIHEPEILEAINKNIIKYEQEYGLGLVIGNEEDLKYFVQ